MPPKELTQQIAFSIYEYRLRNGIGGDEQSDWYKASHFVNMWDEEYRRLSYRGEEEEFLECWCHWNIGV